MCTVLARNFIEFIIILTTACIIIDFRCGSRPSLKRANIIVKRKKKKKEKLKEEIERLLIKIQTTETTKTRSDSARAEPLPSRHRRTAVSPHAAGYEYECPSSFRCT